MAPDHQVPTNTATPQGTHAARTPQASKPLTTGDPLGLSPLFFYFCLAAYMRLLHLYYSREAASRHAIPLLPLPNPDLAYDRCTILSTMYKQVSTYKFDTCIVV